MQSNLFLLFWRSKAFVLIIGSSLVLLILWTWTLFDTTNYISEEQHILNNFANTDNSNNHAYLLQKLISQANRVLRYQRDQTIKVQQQASLAGLSVVARNPASTLSEASAQTLSLVARRKKAPIVGENFLFEEERLKILENQQRQRNGGLEDLNNMDYERMLSSAERQTQYEHELQRMGVPAIPGIGPEGPSAPQERLVHLDLKGAPPKLSFLKQLLPMLKTLGATGLLVEYEDMFPYTGVLQPLSAKNPYNPAELKDFLETATKLGLSIMPLVQSFGHMEYALKLGAFAHMREISESPQSICPSLKDSMTFIEHMLSQVIEFHLGASAGANNPSNSGAPSIKMSHIHIGCDEVFRMGECSRCRQRSRNEIFLTHVTTVANFVRSHWPKLSVVIWDDMLRGMTLTEMHNSHIGSYVQPMIWVYVNDIYQFIQPQLWDMYSKVFPTAWAASAFKGAFGESLMIPPLQRHLENNIRWLAVIAKEGARFSKGFKGLALTGWQRYDHFAVLCELLPTGIPSLITALSTVSKGYFSTNPKENTILNVLECAFYPDSRRSGHPWIELHPNSHHSQLFMSCTYPGSLIYKYGLRLFDKLLETHNYLQRVQEKSAWMTDYNVRHNFSSPLGVRRLTEYTPNLINELSGMAREAHALLNEVYDEHTIAEFIEQNIYPTIVSLRRQLDHAQSLLQPHTWPQRPLPYARELVDLNLIPSDPSALNQQPPAHLN